MTNEPLGLVAVATGLTLGFMTGFELIPNAVGGWLAVGVVLILGIRVGVRIGRLGPDVTPRARPPIR